MLNVCFWISVITVKTLFLLLSYVFCPCQPNFYFNLHQFINETFYSYNFYFNFVERVYTIIFSPQLNLLPYMMPSMQSTDLLVPYKIQIQDQLLDEQIFFNRQGICCISLDDDIQIVLCLCSTSRSCIFFIGYRCKLPLL